MRNLFVQWQYDKIVRASYAIFASVVINFVYFTFLVQINFLWLFGTMPGINHLENPKSDLASELYSADNVLLGKYFRENRSPVNYEEISPNVIETLIITEDQRFYEHSGIDLKGALAIFWYMLKGDPRGGSTITQQLAKNLFKTRVETSKGGLGYIPGVSVLIAKVKEWILAVRLEKNFTKEELLTMYLNTVDFGSNSFGIKVAARTFFNTSPDSLTYPQSAVLIGLLKAPTSYSPVLNPEKSKERRNVLLHLLFQAGKISQSEYKEMIKQDLGLDYKVENHTDGLATYFRSTVSKYLLNWCKSNGKDLYADGLKIYTTIDATIQKHAEDAMQEHMKQLQSKFYVHWKGRNPWIYENGKEIPRFIEDVARRTEGYRKLKAKYGENNDSIDIIMNTPVKMTVFSWDGDIDTLMSPMDSIRYYKHILHSGMMAVDPSTGEIRAWVGGINFKYFKYDHVKQSKRQPGSAFKPFVYATAIQKGYTPCTLLPDVPITIRYEENGEMKSWSPKNSDWVFTGDSMTLRKAMARSVNSIAAHLIKQIGITDVIQTARKLGITSELESVPSLCLGSSDVSVYEMTGAYSAFVNGGVWVEPMFISRIEDRNGNVLYEEVPKTRDALTEEQAYIMVHMLKGGVEERGGTSQELFRYNIFKGNEIGGKTGTTSNYSDGWYMGITKGLVAGVWVGGEDRAIHFRTSQLGEGAKVALPMFGIFLEKLYADTSITVEKGYFKKPKKLSVNIHCPSRPENITDSTEVLKSGEGIREEELIDEENGV